jgi:hypothetical protein
VANFLKLPYRIFSNFSVPFQEACMACKLLQKRFGIKNVRTEQYRLCVPFLSSRKPNQIFECTYITVYPHTGSWHNPLSPRTSFCSYTTYFHTNYIWHTMRDMYFHTVWCNPVQIIGWVIGSTRKGRNDDILGMVIIYLLIFKGNFRREKAGIQSEVISENKL